MIPLYDLSHLFTLLACKVILRCASRDCISILEAVHLWYCWLSVNLIWYVYKHFMSFTFFCESLVSKWIYNLYWFRYALCSFDNSFWLWIIYPFSYCLIIFQGFAVPKEAQGRVAKFSFHGQPAELKHGSVVIAAITSCTNTSNPSVMLGAGLVAKKACELGLQVRLINLHHAFGLLRKSWTIIVSISLSFLLLQL